MNYNIYNVEKQKRKCPLWIKITVGVLFAILLCFMGFVFYLNIILEYHEVKGISMYPTLNGQGTDSDYVYSLRTKDVQRGDIIIYTPLVYDDTEEEKLVIKRLIALEGDHVMVKADGGYENGYLTYGIYIKIGGEGEWQFLEEHYVAVKSENYSLSRDLYTLNLDHKDIRQDEDGNSFLVVQPGYFFALGDNRAYSNDCGDYGPTPIEQIEGKVIFVIYDNHLPIFQAIGQLFGGRKWK